MTDEAGVVWINPEMEQTAIKRAKERAENSRWSLEIALFLFAILIMVIILAIYTKAGLEIVAPVAIFGLGMVWLAGWRRGKQLYQRFYDEELSRLEKEFKKTVKTAVEETIEETIEEKVQRALRQRLR